MESLKIFDNFKISDLDEDWIQSIWNGEFMIFNEPPDEYLMFIESEDMRLLLHKCYIIVKAWLLERTDHNDPESCFETSWNTLIIMDVKVRAILAVLGYIIKNGQSKEADENSRQSSLYAINLYFIFLAVPGSNAFNVFHPNLYQHAIETIKIHSEQLQPVTKKRRKSMNLDDLVVTDELMNENYVLSHDEKEILMKDLNTIVSTFIIMIRSFWFKDHIRSLDITIHGLVEVTKIEDDSMLSQHIRYRDDTVVSLSQNAYVALCELCSNKHGPIDVTITFIAKYILPRFLCNHMDVQMKVFTNIRENTIHFLKNLLCRYEKDATSAILTLIQHLMLNCPDRLEARQRQVGILVKLLGICKHDLIVKVFRNVILLSHHSKIPFRLFAQELIGKLLIESFLINCNLMDNLKIKAKRILFATVLSRCMDCSSMVRGKAIAIIAEFTESDSEIDKAMFQAIFNESDPNKKFVTFQELKNALSENVDLLPGSNVLIKMLMERIEDERAMIRRSTLQIMKNLILMFPNLIKEVVSVISRRCRDPALLVRRFAVQVLSQLLQQFPDNSQLLHEWVQTVLPQIFDIEIKVQEKVLEYLQELLLNKIKDVSTSADTDTNSLPWKILNTLANMKMRKHLSKACNMWVKNGGIITNSVVKNIQSHIGTSNNIGAWVFLVALAENTKLPNMNKYISNYKEILEYNNFCTSLVLQVLRYSWKSLDHEVLEHLHVYMYKCLQQFKINYGLISICLDIIYNIILYLNPDKGNNLLELYMQNLMKISETEIAKIFKNESEIVDTVPNYLKAMFTLGNATLLCTSKISPSTLRILQGMLLEWEALPEAIKEINELQPSAVVILGQQAVRDREVAKEIVPIFGRLMRQETNLDSVIHIAMKINTAKALADICIRFTALVEPYLSDMCVSMKDSSPQVREAIMVIFIQLLLEDYIKIKGPFFFHILTMLSDSDSMIRELTNFLIEERLLTKNKTLISQQFLQSIYHYNNYRSQHKVYDLKMREKERKALTLPGKKNEEKRKIIYDFMLDHLDPPGKIKLLVKITSQILGGTCVDSINVKKEEGVGVLKDALYVIGNKRLRPSSFNKHSDDDQQESEETIAQTVTPTTNAMAVIIEGIKKHGLEVLLPVLIKLRIKLSVSKSTLENEVKKLLVKTYSEYNKDQLSNILSEYPNLEKEIEQFKKQLEDVNSNDEDSNEEGTSLPETNKRIISEKNSDLTAYKLSPTIVIERVSDSQLSNWKRALVNPSSRTTPVNGWDSIPLASPSELLGSPTQPGPSTSTPKSFKYLDSNGHVTKARRLSTFFQAENLFDNFQCPMEEVQYDSKLISLIEP
nr:PREDICTED: condensin-2 complex subunit D3-like isoform X1 [Megachile rotundata]